MNFAIKAFNLTLANKMPLNHGLILISWVLKLNLFTWNNSLLLNQDLTKWQFCVTFHGNRENFQTFYVDCCYLPSTRTCQNVKHAAWTMLLFSESDFVAAFTILYFSSTTLFKSIYVCKKSRVVGEEFVGKI